MRIVLLTLIPVAAFIFVYKKDYRIVAYFCVAVAIILATLDAYIRA